MSEMKKGKMMSDLNLSIQLAKNGEHDGADIMRLWCAAEDSIKLRAELEEVKSQLLAMKNKAIECASELNCMIDMANAKMEINCTDSEPPDYFDHQTVHETMVEAKKSEKLLEGEQ